MGFEVQVSLRVMGPDLDPEEVSRLFGLTPTESHRRGYPHEGREGRKYADFSEGLWSMGLPAVEGTVERAIGRLLEPFRLQVEVLRQLAAQGHRLDVFVGIFGRGSEPLGFGLSPQLLQALGELGLELDFDIYP